LTRKNRILNLRPLIVVDEIGQPRVEHGVVVPAHLMRPRAGDSDVAHTRCASDESAPRRHLQR
jgi:hypothetical protein